MRSTAVAAALAAATLGLFAGPAAAAPPQRFEVTLHNPVQDQGEACGFPVLWDINLTVRGTNFFSKDGVLIRQQAHVREDNTITNLATGRTLREGPDSFTQTIRFNANGTIRTITATGLAVNVRGDQRLKDVGRVVWLPGTNELVFAAGPHPVREAIEFGTLRSALRAFCGVLS